MAIGEILPRRCEIPSGDQWDVQSIYPDDAAWERSIGQLLAELPALEAFGGRLGEGPEVLADALDLSNRLVVLVRRITQYAHLHHVVDTADQRGLARRDRVRSVGARVESARAFIRPELIALGFDKPRKWADGSPRLSLYSHWLDLLERDAAHTRSAEVEQLLGALGEAFAGTAAIHGVLCNAEMAFRPAVSGGQSLPVANGTIGTLLAGDDREVRRQAWENYADGFLAHKSTIATCLATGIKQAVFTARTRRYPSSLEMRLEQNQIPRAVFDNLLEAFGRHLPTWHRYWDVRRRALGIERMREYDIHAMLGRRPPRVSFAEASEMILQGMRPMGEDYIHVMRRGLTTERWVDWRPNQGKQIGAFASSCPGVHPFVHMTFNDDLGALSTLAHELGHAMHGYYTNTTQPLVYAGYTLFAAEVASNFNQAMVRRHLMQANSDREFQIALIEETLGNFHRYFFLMPTLARFEQEAHARAERGEPLTAASLMDLTADLFAEGYGPTLEMDRQRTGITFAQFPNHLYSHFYVYQYATGIAAAHALVDRVLTGGQQAVADYLGFLKAGSSLYPLDALKRAGVDMTSPEPVEKAFGVLADAVDRLERLI